MIRGSLNSCLFLFILVLSGSCVFEEEGAPEPTSTFVKYFGNIGTQEIVDMVINTDDHVVMFGNQTLAGETGNAYLIEADSVGNQLRTMTIDVGTYLTGDSSYITQEFSESIKLFDQGYLVTGSFAELRGGQTQQFNIFWAWLDFDLSIVKLDTIRTGPYSAVGANADHVYGRDIIMTNDGNIVIVGKTSRKERNDLTNNAQEQFFIVKVDFDADTTLIRKSYGYRNSDDDAIAAFELSNSNIAIIGSTYQIGNRGGTDMNVGLLVFNPLLTSQVTARVYGVSIGDDIGAMDQPNDAIRISGGFAITGTSTLGTEQRPFLMQIWEAGALVFEPQALSSKWNINATGASLTETREGDFVITGSYPSFLVSDETIDEFSRAKNSEVMFLRTGQRGTPKPDYEGNFGLVSGNDEGKVVAKLSSGSILIGATIDFGSTQTMIALKKLNDSGILQRQ